ncbi:MAG: peptidase M16, partial [Clostridiales bacterium]|nr:peptidase M16 [Clostridiales bacterium]
MELNINDKLYGFTVTGIRDISEFEGQLIEMIHDKTGAGLVWAKSKEENKLFSVGFRTLPEDNTGVFHILEHSVLCGSDRFPVREPFVELLKTSMNTFLNAMTYSDKTLYPVSSRMEQDYLNLTEVYLDAVFRPAIMSNPNIFYQEGWHIDTLEGEPAYKGVVFNEMKGAMSDVDQVAERTLGKLLFPDTCYGYNSGGDPDAIPDLTYEDFISRYKRFYHPSNSYFYLDGDIPLERTLELIDSYLSEYDHLDDIPSLDMQEPVKKNDVISFTAADEDSKAMIVYGRIAGTWEDRDKLIALSVLTEQLADSNESPLKRAVLSSGIAEDMEIYVSDGIAQPYVMIIFRGIDPSAAGAPAELDYAGSVQYAGDRLMELLSSTAERVISDGLSERDLQASINQLDFRFRQYPEPQGLYRANAVFNSWLYGGDPALYLKSSDAIAAVRAMVSGDDFNELAKEYFINTSEYSQLTLLPSATLGEENSRLEAERVSRE